MINIKDNIKNKILEYNLAIALSFNLFTGCNFREERTELSSILHEPATISETVYSPSIHGSGVGPTIDFNGNVGIAITSVNIPEKYAVVFKCQHGKFIIEGSNKKYKDLWERLNEGDSVRVNYREMYRSAYQDTNNDGKKDLLSKKLIDYDFLEALVINKKIKLEKEN